LSNAVGFGRFERRHVNFGHSSTGAGRLAPSADAIRVNVSSATASAAWGMNAAATRFNGAADRVATGSADLATDLVDATITAPAAFALNATVLRVADETQKSLIDILA
jgi:hypothetical protein